MTPENVSLQSVASLQQVRNDLRLKIGEYDANQQKEDSLSWTSLVPIQPRGGRIPFFLVPGTYLQKDVFLDYLANVVTHLGLEQPVYGFNARGLDGRDRPHASVEEMARDYVKELRAFQPEGPYLLGGECIGGVVAFEMAQQLRAQNQETAALVLIDTVCPSWWSTRRFQATLLKTRLYSIMRRLFCIFQPDLRKGFTRPQDPVRFKQRLRPPINEAEQAAQRAYQIERLYAGLIFQYRPKTYPGRITLIVNEKDYTRKPILGWQGMAGDRIISHRVPGTQLTRITKHAIGTAERLRLCLDDASRLHDLPARSRNNNPASTPG